MLRVELPAGSGRVLRTTPVFETYWRFAHARQEVFHRRVAGSPPPWTADPVISAHRFTNVFRASDRVSQHLISEVLYRDSDHEEEVFFRCILFKIFNKVDTYEALRQRFGEISWRNFSLERYASALDERSRSGCTIYSSAYIMPSPSFGAPRKHRNHLQLIERMMVDKVPLKVVRARSLKEVYELLLSYPSLGPFLAFQFAIDLNYSEICNFSEMDFVVAGPGARDGIRKCFSDTAGMSNEDVIRVVTDHSEAEFERLALPFRNLWGRPMQLIDCQNVFCEVDKYARVAHPEFSGVSGRTRIKQRYSSSSPRSVPQWYPPKWRVHVHPAEDSETHVGAQLSLLT